MDAHRTRWTDRLVVCSLYHCTRHLVTGDDVQAWMLRRGRLLLHHKVALVTDQDQDESSSLDKNVGRILHLQRDPKGPILISFYSLACRSVAFRVGYGGGRQECKQREDQNGPRLLCLKLCIIE